MDYLPCRSYDAMKRQATNGGRKNRSKPGNLREQVNPLMCKAYKDASIEANKKWRTPSASDGEGGVKTGESIAGDPQPKIKLRDHVNHEISDTSKKKLNPSWVEQLMGIPVGWTEIGFGSDNRVDRLRLCGNGVVPQTAAKAFITLWERLISNVDSSKKL